MSFVSIGYVAHSVDHYDLISEKDINEINNKNLSRLTFGIIESVLSKPITIIFSQGNFHLSPLIACLFAQKEKADVLVGKPKVVFNETYKREKEIYFSLTYKEKLTNGVISNSNFFYKDLLLCSGLINTDRNSLERIGIEVYPELGTREYRIQYRNETLKKLHDGLCKTIPKIVVVPIDSIPPSSIFGNIKMSFEKEEIELQDFRPKLIVYESINERGYNFGSIIELIERAKASDIKLILHFSWPYLKDIQPFLDKISRRKYVGLFYFTKNFYKESNNNDIVPHANIRHLSLEGNSWDIYYPNTNSFNFKVFLPASEFQMWDANLEEISNWNWDFDQKLYDLRKYLNHESIEKSNRNILMFPPIINMLVSPSKIKRSLQSEGNWYSVPIQNSFDIQKRDLNSVKLFRSMCRELDCGCDLSYKIKGIFTPFMPTKKTLFQAYLIGSIAEQITNIKFPICEENSENSSLIIANLYPNLKTTLSFFETIEELISSINSYISSIKIKVYFHGSDKVEFSINTSNIQFRNTIFENRTFIKNAFRDIKKQLSYDCLIETSIINTDDSHTIELYIKTPVPYIQFSQFDKNTQKADIKPFAPLILYSFTINKDGSYNEYKLKKIWSHRSVNKSSIYSKISYSNASTPQRSMQTCIVVYYRQLTDIEKMPQSTVKASKLIIPGPIPFTTAFTGEILVTQGYNTLLLPFVDIIFFTYPGKNFAHTLSHIKLYEDLNLRISSDIARRDLDISLKYTKKSNKIRYPSRPTIKNKLEYTCENDTPIDSFIRNELMNSHSIEEEIKNEIKSLKNIWKSIGSQFKSSYQLSTVNYAQEQISFLVDFKDGVNEVSFTIGTVVRKEDNGDYILSTVDNLQVGDKIFYVQTEDRESIENYLLKFVLKDEIPIETILEPLTALNTFYTTLKSINFEGNFDPSCMKKLYWLNLEQKESLFYLIQYAFHENTLLTKKSIIELYESHIWNGYIPIEDSITIIQSKQKKITMSKLFYIATKLGLKEYKEISFKQLCSMALRDQKHYYFNIDENLSSLGRLLGHQGIIEDYLLINDEGKKIGTFLKMVAFSLKRVANDQTDSLNEIDILLQDKIKSCTIREILSQTNEKK